MNNGNPILNNPYKPPEYHYATDPKDGSLNYNDKRKGRRIFSRERLVIPTKQVQAALLELNTAVFTRVEPLASAYIHAEGFYQTKKGERKAF